MKFDELNKIIPYAQGGKAKILRMQPYNAITLRLPGRHASDTEPKGGDFVVCVDDEEMDWTEHQFTHDDIFEQVARLKNHCGEDLMMAYNGIVNGASPESFTDFSLLRTSVKGAMHPRTFMYAVQCLAVAEHRRYAKFEAKFGGRYLPFRFAIGIADGLWTANDAIAKQKYGRPGVEQLEREFGIPAWTKALMNAN